MFDACGRKIAFFFTTLNRSMFPPFTKKKSTAWFTEGQQIYASFKSVQLHLGGLGLDVFRMENKHMNYSGTAVVNSLAVSDQFLWCHIS